MKKKKVNDIGRLNKPQMMDMHLLWIKMLTYVAKHVSFVPTTCFKIPEFFLSKVKYFGSSDSKFKQDF